MLTEEWGLQLQPPSPWRAGAATFAAFLLAGSVPLAPTVFMLGREAGPSFAVGCVLTGVAFFGIGYVRGRVVDRRPLASAFETLFIGGAAALVAYAVGR